MLQKVTYVSNETIITAENLNNIQDAVIDNSTSVNNLTTRVNGLDKSINGLDASIQGKAPQYQYSTTDPGAGSRLASGTLYIVYA